jgi:hypothetical protein
MLRGKPRQMIRAAPGADPAGDPNHDKGVENARRSLLSLTGCSFSVLILSSGRKPEEPKEIGPGHVLFPRLDRRTQLASAARPTGRTLGLRPGCRAALTQRMERGHAQAD